MQNSDAPTLDEFVTSLSIIEMTDEALPFDRMMFDVYGEVNRIRDAIQSVADIGQAIRAFDRACARVYQDREVSPQRKISMRTAEWILKSAYVWKSNNVSASSATRWFDAWQHEKNMAYLEL